MPQLKTNLRLRGKVQWILTPEDIEGDEDQEPGMGIGFVYKSAAERERVESAVETLMEESLGPVIYRKLLDKHQS